MSGFVRTAYGSWGRTLQAVHDVAYPATPDAVLEDVRSGPSPVIAYGCGRSYGDVALNTGNRLIDTRGLDRFISFNNETGVLTAEAGVRLADILAVCCRPDADGSGWMLPVTPGTRFVTLGGAIANDVHGKNHHTQGTFGCHVLSFELARSDRGLVRCAPSRNPELFAATIGGLGLTGLITSATIQLRRVSGLAVEAEDIQFGHLNDYLTLAEESDQAWEYTAAWVDCLATGASLGRGIFSRARHVPNQGTLPPAPDPRLNVPFVPPASLVTPASVRAFNATYWRKLGRKGRARRIGSYGPVFYPLDALGRWNRLYGPRGFYQFQCQLPSADMEAVLTELLTVVANSGQASMLSVLKLFGDRRSPGLLSFPAPGATLAMDFANRGESTRTLLRRLEDAVRQAGGRLYPAKDALMTPETFHSGYPGIERFRWQLDPAFASDFARRVGLLPRTSAQVQS